MTDKATETTDPVPSVAERQAQAAENKYWSAATDKEGKGLIWVGSEYRPDWRKAVVGEDKRKKVSKLSGSKNHAAVLTEADIPAIHLAYRAGETTKYLANKYGVCQATISDILTCKTWKNAWDKGPSLKNLRSAHYKGESSPNAKLDEDKVRKIRCLSRNGMSQSEIARLFNVSGQCVHCIIIGKTWTSVRDFDTRPIPRGLSWAKLDEQKVCEIRRRAVLGESTKLIAKSFGVSRNTVRSVLTGRTWKHVEYSEV